jgi:hypothetical protein
MTDPAAARDVGAALRAHIEELLAEHLVSADYRPHVVPCVDARRRHVVIAPVFDRADYLAALTQIGRIVTGTEDVEVAVEWARQRALFRRSSES